MRRHQQLRQCAAFYPSQFHFFESSRQRDSSERRLRRPSLFLQLALLALLAAFFLGARLHAQTSTITGTVVDPSGAPIRGAQVQITSRPFDDLTRQSVSAASGTYRALNLPTAPYQVKVTASGMED